MLVNYRSCGNVQIHFRSNLKWRTAPKFSNFATLDRYNSAEDRSILLKFDTEFDHVIAVHVTNIHGQRVWLTRRRCGSSSFTDHGGWLRSTVVERRSLAGELSLSCARPAANGWPLMWVNRPLQVSQLGQLSLLSFRGRQMRSKVLSDMCYLAQVAPSGESLVRCSRLGLLWQLLCLC